MRNIGIMLAGQNVTMKLDLHDFNALQLNFHNPFHKYNI